MATLEQIIHEAQALSLEEKMKLREALDQELERRAVPTRSRVAESNWIERNRQTFVGQWVAIQGEALIAQGTNARDVYLSTLQAGIQCPYIVHMTPNEDAYIGGW
jgi:hypothetical protein